MGSGSSTQQCALRYVGALPAEDGVLENLGEPFRYGAALAAAVNREVVNRPAAGVTTRRPEEPYVNSTSTVLWELGRVTAPATRLRDRRQQERIVAPQTSWPWRIGERL